MGLDISELQQLSLREHFFLDAFACPAYSNWPLKVTVSQGYLFFQILSLPLGNDVRPIVSMIIWYL